MASNKHVDLKKIESFLRSKSYPQEISKDKGKKANFRKSCKNFKIVDGHLSYKEKRRVIFDNDRKKIIIHDIHEGLGDNPKAKALAAHRGRESTYQKLAERFYWHNMIDDVKEYIKSCQNCQQQGKMFKKISPELQSIPIPSKVMNQIGVDVCSLPEVDGFQHIIVCIDYFSKWSEAKAVKNKSASTVANFLYEIICRHGCIKIQINDQGKEFVNQVAENLHKMTGTEQRITSAYHPQTNGLCERQNRTIKDSLIKVLEEKAEHWPEVIDGVLFAHRVSVHTSTKYSPFFLLYNRHPTLPIDIRYNFTNNEGNKNPYDYDTFQSVLHSALSIREATHNQASCNIKKAQEKQQRDYNNRHSNFSSTLRIGSKVLLQNQKRQDRKGGKFTYKWTGPYTIKATTKTGLCTLVNKQDETLRKKYNVSLLKPFFSNDTTENDDQQPLLQESSRDEEEKAHIYDERYNEHVKNLHELDTNYFNNLPDEIVEIILLFAGKSVAQSVDTYHSLIKTCSRFKSIIERRKAEILPQIHVKFPEAVFRSLPKRRKKIKISVKRLLKCFGQYSAVSESVNLVIARKNWKSAWMLIEEVKYHWFMIERIFWKSKKQRVHFTPQANNITVDLDNNLWLHNELYSLKKEDQKILFSKQEWMNDRIMDAAQKLICREIGSDSNFQSVLNSQIKVQLPFQPVTQEHIQLLHDGSHHWFLSFCSNGRVQICDSLYTNLTQSSKKSIQSLYKHFVANDGKLLITFLPVQKQPDGHNCGPFAIAYAAEILEGNSPTEAIFSVQEMRGHLIKCLENQKLTPFPKA